MSRRFVLTGGPCVGKTTTLNALGERGFHIVPETPRIIIEEQQKIGGRALPWIDFKLFQTHILARQIDAEASLPKDKISFLDRGMPDPLAYHLLNGIEIPEPLHREARKMRYDGVFLLDKLPNYETDSARREDPETAARIHELIRKSYMDVGYELIDVPALSLEKRIEFILSSI